MKKREVKRRRPWTRDEDDKLSNYVDMHGNGHWNTVAGELGLGRSGNSCRLRWMNYLSPTIRRGSFTHQEVLLILKHHFQMGNKWSKIAKHLPGRTDNQIKNFWNTKIRKQAKLLNIQDLKSLEFLQIMTSKYQPPPPPPAVATNGGGSFSSSTGNPDIAGGVPELSCNIYLGSTHWTSAISAHLDDDQFASIWTLDQPPSFGTW